MLRRTISAVFAVLAGLVIAASAGGAGASGERQRAPGEDQLLETITVTPGASRTSETNFQSTETYKVVFSGTMHTQCEKGSPFFGATHDEDVFYYYNASDQDGPLPQPRGVNFFFTGRLFYSGSLPAFSEGHTYTTVPPPGLTGHFAFGDTYPGSQLEHCTRTGAWTIQIYRVETGTTKTVSEPAPGKSVDVFSPDLPPAGVDCAGSPGKATATRICEVRVTWDDKKRIEEEVVLTEGDLYERGRLVTLIFVDCWLSEDKGTLTPKEKLRGCINYARHIYDRRNNGLYRAAARVTSRPNVVESAHARSAGCTTQRIRIQLRIKKGKVVRATRAKNQKRRSAVRYTCSISGNTKTLTLHGPSNLRKALGKRLDLRVYRSKKAGRAGGKLSVTFGWK